MSDSDTTIFHLNWCLFSQILSGNKIHIYGYKRQFNFVLLEKREANLLVFYSVCAIQNGFCVTVYLLNQFYISDGYEISTTYI